MTFERAIADLITRLYPGRELAKVEPLAPDTGATAGASTKVAGYGKPVRIVLASRTEPPLELVWRVTSANEFGHDRRADRAAVTLQAYDDFARMPRHVAPVDIGVIDGEGRMHSIRDGGELYLVTTYAAGSVYADDLRRVADTGIAEPRDLARIDALAAYLAELHRPVTNAEVRYRRAIRDLVGSGEGIYGIVDGYPPDVPGAAPQRLRALEEECASWRWKLRDAARRVTRTHGDFHPFNIVFAEDHELTLLDASRGGCGDPADDVTALAVNFVLFALGRPAAWSRGLGVLWRRWWTEVAARRPDPELRLVCPPFFAWRALVVANPRFYPNLAGGERDRLLGLAERFLEDAYVDPAAAEELFA